MSLSPSLLEPYNYGAPAYTTSPPRSFSPAVEPASISPPTLSYHLSAGEVSSDESHMATAGRRSRGSPAPSIPYASTVPRSHRYNPIAIPATRANTRAAHRRRASKSNEPEHDSDAEEEEDYQGSGGADP